VFKLHPKTVSQYLHITLTTMATMHIVEFRVNFILWCVYLGAFCVKSAVGSRKHETYILTCISYL